MSEEESNQVINQLKREINCLKTDLIRFKLLSNSYKKYFEYFNEINETIDSNEEILNLRNIIKVVKEGQKSCFVSVEKLNENQLNRNELNNNSREFRQISTQTEIIETNRRLRAKEVFTQTEVNRSESNKTDETIALKNEILKLKEDIKILQFSNEKTCFVSLKQLKENVFKHKSKEVCEQNLRTDFTQTYVETTHISTQTQELTELEIEEDKQELNDEDVSDNDSEGIDCDINYTNLSNDETIDGIIDENNEQNSLERENSIESTENAMKLNIKNEIQSEDNEEKVQNESQIRIENIRSLSTYEKRELNSINDESEDGQNDIECNGSSDIDCDFRVNYEKLKKFRKQISPKFKCGADGCSYLSKTNYDLMRHKARKHSKGKPFVCSIEGCNKRFGFKLDLVRHEKYHKLVRNGNQIRDKEEVVPNESQTQIGNLRPKRKCKITSFSVETDDNDNEFNDNSDTDYDSNEKTVHNINAKLIPYKYVCGHIGCGKKLKTTDSLKRHENIHSGVEYKCEWKDCNAVYRTQRGLKEHIRQHEGLYPCTHEGCNYKARGETHLKDHELSHSKDRYQYICLINDCNKQFTNSMALKNHELRAHPLDFSDIPWIECTENNCKFKTKLKIDYRKHERRHTRPYVCNVCEKKFGDTKTLKNHMTSHSSELKIPCDWPGCESRFITRAKMRDHMNSHTLEKTHTCYWPHCGKTFISKSSLYMHILRHKGKGRYNCPHCEYGSTNTIRYKNHMKTHENPTNES